jgi:hypothetical protein
MRLQRWTSTNFEPKSCDLVVLLVTTSSCILQNYTFPTTSVKTTLYIVNYSPKNTLRGWTGTFQQGTKEMVLRVTAKIRLRRSLNKWTHWCESMDISRAPSLLRRCHSAHHRNLRARCVQQRAQLLHHFTIFFHSPFTVSFIISLNKINFIVLDLNKPRISVYITYEVYIGMRAPAP